MDLKKVEISVDEFDYLRSCVMDYLRETNIANHMGSDDEFTERMCKIGDDIFDCFYFVGIDGIVRRRYEYDENEISVVEEIEEVV